MVVVAVAAGGSSLPLLPNQPAVLHFLARSSRSVVCRETDRQTDMSNLLGESAHNLLGVGRGA